MKKKRSHGNDRNKYASKDLTATKWVQLRITDKEKKLWLRLAKKEGDGTLSKWIKEIVRNSIK